MVLEHIMVKAKSYQLGLYEKAMPSHLSWIEKCKATKEAGFDFLEISIDETDAKLSRLDYSFEQIKEIKDAIEESGVPILSMCLSGHRRFPLGSHDENVRAQSLIIMEKAIHFAIKLGLRTIQLAGYDVYYEESDASTKQWFDQNLALCVNMASKYGVVLGFETMETPFMDTATKAMFYVNKNQSPYLKLYPDIGNLTNASRKYHISVSDDLNQAKSHIVAAHLKEIIEGHYREIPFGSGDTHYDDAIKCLKAQGVYMYTGEFWYVGSENWVEDLAFANHYLRQKIEKYYD
jgi:L-ribulose-5-phosphate 3-epimerase